ncbi:hypothetical protein PUN28_013268 [Cardiocondyla obscurior]|uniref:Uncharacterized protein n=1 Tax=Cardiocondyla obscurior TaxID=286306 RepID=A0AAW2F7G7_9HYME
MVRAGQSQPGSDNINDDGEHRKACDSLWTNLQVSKIWSQVHDACKNAVKFAVASIGRVTKDAPKSERSQRNPVEVADEPLVKSSSSCAGKICGETCRKNLMRSKNEKKNGSASRAHNRERGKISRGYGGTDAKRLADHFTFPSQNTKARVPKSRKRGRKIPCDLQRRIERVYQTFREIIPLHEFQSTNVLSPEGNIRGRTSATPEQTKSCQDAETCENIIDTIRIKAEWSFMSAIADVTASLTVASPTVPFIRRLCRENRAKRQSETETVCATAMNLWRKRSSIGNKTVVPVLKWSRKRIGKKELSSAAATTHDNGVKITQIESSAVQTAREGNKRRAYVNLQMQTPDAIVAVILSEFLLSSEKKKGLTSIMLQSESDHDKRCGNANVVG